MRLLAFARTCLDRRLDGSCPMRGRSATPRGATLIPHAIGEHLIFSAVGSIWSLISEPPPDLPRRPAALITVINIARGGRAGLEHATPDWGRLRSRRAIARIYSTRVDSINRYSRVIIPPRDSPRERDALNRRDKLTTEEYEGSLSLSLSLSLAGKGCNERRPVTCKQSLPL